jgi:hypothetical protein
MHVVHLIADEVKKDSEFFAGVMGIIFDANAYTAKLTSDQR